MNTRTGWTDHTFNPWPGCTPVSPGCAHCYAMVRDGRQILERVGHRGPGATRLLMGDLCWRLPTRWNPIAELGGRPVRVFCVSMADVFPQEATGAPPGLDRGHPPSRWQLLAASYPPCGIRPL